MAKLSDQEHVHRSLLLSEAYIPYLRERHPMGSVVAINLLNAQYVVGAHSPGAMQMYADKFPDGDGYMYLEPIHWPDMRPLEEQVAAVADWVRRQHKNHSPMAED